VFVDQVRPSWWASLTERFCTVHEVAFVVLTLTSESSSARKKESGTRWLETQLRRLAMTCYIAALRRFSKQKCVLATTPAMHMDSLLGEIVGHFPVVKPVFLRYSAFSLWQEALRSLFWLIISVFPTMMPERPRFTVPVDLLGDVLNRTPDAELSALCDQSLERFYKGCSELLAYCGVSFEHELHVQSDGYWRQQFLRLYKLAQGDAAVLRSLKPALVLSPSAGQVYHFVGALCKVQNIPAMVIPFKTLAKPHDEVAASGVAQIGRDMLNGIYPVAGVQSPLALEYAQATGYSGQLLPVGPLLRPTIDPGTRAHARARLAEATGRTGPVIVYAPSMKDISPLYVTENLDEILHSMQCVIEAGKAHPEAIVILRTHPDPSFRSPELRRLLELPPNVRISDGADRESFVEILALADVLISNMSTTAEDAIRNGIPVILLDLWERYNHFAAPTIRETPLELSLAYYVCSVEALVGTLQWVLAHHPVGALLPDALKTRYVFGEEAKTAFFAWIGQQLFPAA
jgi:hypothetical protein